MGFKWPSKRIDRNRKKKSTGTCYAPGGIYITGTIMSEGEQELCSVFRLNRPSKWEMTLVFEQRFQKTARPKPYEAEALSLIIT